MGPLDNDAHCLAGRQGLSIPAGQARPLLLLICAQVKGTTLRPRVSVAVRI
jgi:hypothetical protein